MNLLAELSKTYSAVPGAFSTKGITDAYSGEIAGAQALGTQVANNAGDEYANRAFQSGGSALGAGVAKAQSFLPFLQIQNQLKTEEAGKVQDVTEKGISLQAQLAAQLANLRTNYAEHLASTTLQSRQLDLQQKQMDQTNQLQQKQFGLQSQVAGWNQGNINRQLNWNERIPSGTTINWGNSLGAFSGLAGIGV